MPYLPLHPRHIAEIEAQVEQHEAEVQDAIRALLVRKKREELAAKARLRGAYRKAFREAVATGEADPRATAVRAVQKQAIIDQHDQRVRSTFRKTQDASRRRADRQQRKLDRLSKSAQPHKRRFVSEDRDYVEIIGEAAKGGYLDNTALVLAKINSKLKHYRLDHWDKTTIPLKVMAMAVVGAEQGAQTINLRLSPDIQKKARAAKKGPASYMQERIRKRLQHAFGKDKCPDFWFVIETDPLDQFHLHGMVVTPSSVGARELVDRALREAGGPWKAEGGHQYQQVSDDPSEPLGWASYVVKQLNLSSARMDGRVMANTRAIGVLAAARWDQLRAELPQSPRR